MSWIFFSVLYALLVAVSNTMDKFILNKLVKNPYLPLGVSGVIGAVFAAGIFLTSGFQPLSQLDTALALSTGALFMLAMLFYFKAMKVEEVSRVVPFYYIAPAFTLVAAFLFLGESFAPQVYLGIALLIAGAVLVSLRSLSSFRVGKAFWFILAGCVSTAALATLTKHLLGQADFWTVFSYTRIGMAACVVPLIFFYRKDFVSLFRRGKAAAVCMMSLSETITLFAVLSFIFAASIGFVTLVTAMTSFQPLFVLLFALLLSRFYPKILNEDFGRKALLTKAASVALIVCGAFLVA